MKGTRTKIENQRVLQAIKDERENFARNNAYQSAYAKAYEAVKLLRPQQSLNIETPVFADDDEDLHKSLEKARHLALDPSNETVDDQNFTAGESRKNKIVFAEVEESVWRHRINEKVRKPEGGDVFMHDDEAGGWTEVKETQKDEKPNSEDKEDIVCDETIREIAVGKGLSGALKLLKDRGTLDESIEWGGRNMDKKKRKLVGIVEDEGKEAPNKKEIHIERTDEFGRILTDKEAFRIFSHKFHGKGPGKMKQEKRMKQFHQELKLKQMKSSDTPSLSAERMRETQARLKTPYVVLSGDVKPENFSGLKRKAEQFSS